MDHAALELEVVEGPELTGADGGLGFPVGETVAIGRARDSRLCLPDPTVSRNHASIASRAGRWFVDDLSSRHGTLLNAVRLESNLPHALDQFDLLRIGPWTFRVRIGGRGDSATYTVASKDDDALAQRISQVDGRELAQHRLHLILDGAARINSARTEPELSQAVVESVLAGTNFSRAALIREHGHGERVELLYSRGQGDGVDEDGKKDDGEFTFSRSLLQASATGQVARLTSDDRAPLGASIAQLGITDALCAPVMLGGAVAAYLYLDARDQHLPIQADAADFCQAIARMCGLALANLKREELEHRQRSLEGELSAAREAQQLIVPATQDELHGLRYSMEMRPGSFVAGDLFDVVVLDENRVAVVIGDVTGEGIGSAILMASAQAHLHAALKTFADPARALNEVNTYVSERSPLNKFISMWVGVFDLNVGRLTLVDAGHGHWWIRRADGTMQPPGMPDGTLVGIDAVFEYGSRTIDIAIGDRIILFSDGVVEQMSPGGEQFGKDNIGHVLGKSGSVGEDVESIFAAVIAHAGSPKLADDATVASVEVLVGG